MVLLELACDLADIIVVKVNAAYQKHDLRWVLERFRSEVIYYVVDFIGKNMHKIADAASDVILSIKYRILLTGMMQQLRLVRLMANFVNPNRVLQKI